MAPDLNSVPPSPVNAQQSSTTSSRRDTDVMAPPSLPHISSSIGSSHTVNREPTTTAYSGMDGGHGPLRHPRPLTAAELHLQLEKEQEAVVNRLSRELSLLRQQTASVASTTSSTSTGLAEPNDAASSSHRIPGSSHPTPSRRHRSSSSLSTRSANTAATTASGFTGMSGTTVGTTGGVAGSTISGIAPARDSGTSRYPTSGDSLSRNGSITSRRSQASSPSLASSQHQGEHFPTLHPHRQSNPPSYQPPFSPSSNRSSVTANTRYEEVAHHRAELEMVKRENESLRRRIRELERSLSNRRQSDTGRSASEINEIRVDARSAATESTQQRGLSAENDEDDAVKVGESAGSIGVGGGH